MSGPRAFRGRIVHCTGDPDAGGLVEHFEDGLLLVDEGRVRSLGPAETLIKNLSEDIPVTHWKGSWILPGFIDCHVHYPQLDVIASYGEKLLDWLETYTYPAEEKFADPDFARVTAEQFLDRMLANGTTSAMVFATVHAHSAKALFSAAHERNLRLWTGKVLMDRNCPESLRDTAVDGIRESRELIDRWHGQDRLQYAITPRFAPTSTAHQLDLAGQLATEYPDVYIHSHLAESQAELEWVAELFPDADTYTDVYRDHRLLRERSIYAHCIHMEDDSVATMASAGAAIAFCPSSNLFLGSGLFDLDRARVAGVRVGLGTDVGGGTSLSLLRTVHDGYKALQLKGQSLAPERALYLATLGAARALYASDRIGNFAVGKEADFVVLDPARNLLLQRRLASADTVRDRLFALLMLGDDRLVRQTYIMGRPALKEA